MAASPSSFAKMYEKYVNRSITVTVDCNGVCPLYFCDLFCVDRGPVIGRSSVQGALQIVYTIHNFRS
jgi:hypothetical protein